jgi:hypothetical protein
MEATASSAAGAAAVGSKCRRGSRAHHAGSEIGLAPRPSSSVSGITTQRPRNKNESPALLQTISKLQQSQEQRAYELASLRVREGRVIAE